MPLLVWSETDFATCLEVLPAVEEYDVSYSYRVKRCGLRLDLTVYPYASDIYITLFREGVETPIFDMKLIECAGTRYINDERGEYLEFAPGKALFGNRYDGFVIPFGFRLSVKPCISIKLFSEPAGL
jgi:hypothetical protein